MTVDPEGHIIAKSQSEEDEAVIDEIELNECARARKGNIQTGATSELSRREASDLHSDSNIIRVIYAYTWYKDERRPVSLSFVIHENCTKPKRKINLSILVIPTQFTIDRFNNTGIKFIKTTF